LDEAKMALLDGGRHVLLDLRLCECPVVDPQLIELALEVLAIDGVAADPERVGVHLVGTGHRRGGDQGAVHVEAQLGAVVASRDMGPGVHWERRDPGDLHAADAVDGAGADRLVAGASARSAEEVGIDFLLHDGSPPGRRDRRVHPCFEGGGGREIEGVRVVDAHAVVHAIEQERAAVLPGGPGGAVGERARIVVS